MNTSGFPASAKTLRQRIGEGNIPMQDALHYASTLAEALRKLHDEGRVHGSLTPDAIAVTATGLELVPGNPGHVRVTPYTAPEVAAGHKPADGRSDVFSFGAIVFEMMTGRKAFEAEMDSALVILLCGSPAPPTGNPAVDGLLAGCMAKDPAARWQRIQKVQLELKLLIAASRRAGPAAPEPPADISEGSLRAELLQFAARVDARLQAHEQAVADIQRSASDAVSTLRGQLSSLGSQLSAAQETLGGNAGSEAAIHAAIERAAAPMQQSIDGLIERVMLLERSAAAPAAPLAEFGAGMADLRVQMVELHRHMAADIQAFELNLKTQSKAIESTRTAVLQTDDLVERVVAALESLQTALQHSSDERATPQKHSRSNA